MVSAADFGPTLQVGLTAYTDWPNGEPYHNGGVHTSWHANYAPPGPGQPDIVSEVDYFRIKRPPAALTEAVLQGMGLSYNPATNQTANPPVQLSASPAASPHLGDPADIPLGTLQFGAPPFAANETAATLAVTVTRSGPSQDQPLSVSWQTSPGNAGPDDFTAVSGILTWAAHDPAEKTIFISLANDHLPEGPESLSLSLGTLDGPATFPASAPSLPVTLTIQDHSLDQWRVDRFGPAAALTPEAAPNADADYDGLETLMEYSLNTQPLTASDTAALPVMVTENGRPGLRFSPAAVSPGVRLIVQSSLALGPWTSLASRAPGASQWTIETPGTEVTASAGIITVLAPASNSPRLFFRLRAVVE